LTRLPLEVIVAAVTHYLRIGILTYTPSDPKINQTLTVQGILECREENIIMPNVPGYILYAPPSRLTGYVGQWNVVTNAQGIFGVTFIPDEAGTWRFEAVFNDVVVNGILHIGD